MRYIGYVIGALLWAPYWICVICEAQSNVTISVPPGAVITIPAGHYPTNGMFFTPTNAASITPPPRQPVSDALVAAAFMNMRHTRMEREQLAYLGTQAFEVLEVEEVSWPEPERDERGLPTGRDIPTTNWPTRLKPSGTNAPVIRGASKDGSVTLIFSKPVPAGITIDVNIRQTP